MTWTEIAKRWWVYSEANKTKRLTAAEIRRMEERDDDYLCILRSVKTGVEITRDDLKGERFQVYVPPSRGFSTRYGVFQKLDAMGLDLKNTGFCERTYVFGVENLEGVAKAVGCRKRGRTPSWKCLDAAKRHQFKPVGGTYERV